MATMTAQTPVHDPQGIAEVAAATGLTQDTLRWYEKEGLIPPVDRDSAGRRSYDDEALRMVHLVVRLRRTGMPVAEVREFLTMVEEGAASHGRRMALLAGHRDRVRSHLAQLQEDLGAVETKIAHYSRLIEAGRDCGEQPITDPAIRHQQRSTR